MFVDRGRGEGIRLMLEFAEIPYIETAFTKDTWPAHKRVGTESKLYTFGQGINDVILIIHDFDLLIAFRFKNCRLVMNFWE